MKSIDIPCFYKILILLEDQYNIFKDQS